MKMKKIPHKARKALAEGNIRTANSILGDYYSIEGTVIKGRQLGRTLGFPTANLSLNKYSPLFLANGVYAVRIHHASGSYNGMANIGIRPTFEQHELTIEVNLFDFSDDIYGHKITISFIDRIRDEMKFSNVEALKHQISIDKNQVEGLLSTGNQANSNTQ